MLFVHVAKSGLCSHNLSFLCVKILPELAELCPSEDEVIWNGTVWQRAVSFFMRKIQRNKKYEKE